MMISAIVGNESTNYNYACVSIEKLSDLCVCCTRLRESHRGMSVRIHARSMDSKIPNCLAHRTGASKYSHSSKAKEDNQRFLLG